MSKIESFDIMAFFGVHSETNMNISWDFRAYATAEHSGEQVVNYVMHSKPEFTDPKQPDQDRMLLLLLISHTNLSVPDLCISFKPYPGESDNKLCHPSIHLT